MRERSMFNFENQVELLHHRVKLPPQVLQGQVCFMKPEERHQDIKRVLYGMGKEDERRVKKQSTHAAMYETEECLLYALCLASPIESKLTIEVIKKTTGKPASVPLQKLSLQASYLTFAVSEQGGICLLVGTKCGRLLIYRAFESDSLTVQSVRISSNEITYMLSPIFKNWIFVLNKAGTIYLVNYIEKKVYYEFKCSLPLIEDPKPTLIVDLSQTYIAHVFSYGRIVIWEITEEIKTTLSKNNLCDKTSDSNDKETGDDLKKRKECTTEKQFVLKPKMSISNCVVKGILWCDFIGIFISVIDQQGELRILAVNINQFNQSQQFFTIISRFQICHQKTAGKNHQKEYAVDAVRNRQSNAIFVAKNVEVTNCGQKISKQCFLEKYAFDMSFNVNKIMVISFLQINQMDQLLLNSTAEYLMMRNKNEYCLVHNLNKKLK